METEIHQPVNSYGQLIVLFFMDFFILERAPFGLENMTH